MKTSEVDIMSSKYFSDAELQCHGDGCCDGGAYNVSPRLLELLDQLRENIGGPLNLSCAYRCPAHNAEVGGVPNSQHALGNAADILCPDWLSMGEFRWYVEQLPFDAWVSMILASFMWTYAMAEFLAATIGRAEFDGKQTANKTGCYQNVFGIPESRSRSACARRS